MKKELLKKIDLLLGRDLYYKPETKEKVKWFGDKYAGFYVAPRLLEGRRGIIYSFGVGTNISFDLELIDGFDCDVFAFDPTPKSIEWIKNQKLPANFNFYEFGIDKKDGMVEFYLPDNPDHVSATVFSESPVKKTKVVTVPMKSFGSIINELGHTQIDVLKLDIEGSEYDVLNFVLESGVAIRQILIEFHHRMPYIKDGLNKTKNSVELLRNNGYVISRVSATLEEYSFIKEK
jgi:FkbM family methyltransferase